ncbi:MAG: hypothetical protein K0R69_3152, partial [Clostridia bacterium]|nr:hypothetical protein [Clostridia bacterium]
IIDDKTTEDNVTNSKTAIENNELNVDRKLNSKQSNLTEISEESKIQYETIIMEDYNFVQLMDEVYLNIDKYEGKEIQLIGFVYRSAEYGENEFAVARMLLTCCVADTQLTGFLCSYSKAMELELNSWVKATGTIKSRDYNGDKIPIIAVEKLEKAEKPQDEYVYLG